MQESHQLIEHCTVRTVSLWWNWSKLSFRRAIKSQWRAWNGIKRKATPQQNYCNSMWWFHVFFLFFFYFAVTTNISLKQTGKFCFFFLFIFSDRVVCKCVCVWSHAKGVNMTRINTVVNPANLTWTSLSLNIVENIFIILAHNKWNDVDNQTRNAINSKCLHRR